MDPTAPKQPRNRRRGLIVAVVLVLVSMVSWWNWPRGDARFVGKWSAQIEGDAGPYGVIVFQRNGESRFSPTGYKDSRGGPWRVEQNRLVMTGKTSGDWSVFEPVITRLEAWTGTTLLFNVDLDPLEITTVSPNEIRLKNTETGRNYVFSRIPE
jgi:hypothetical protein